MHPSFSSTTIRVLTGLCLVILLASALYWGGWALFAMLALCAALGQWELQSMFWGHTGHLGGRVLALLACVGLLWAVWQGAAVGFAAFGAICVLFMLYFLIRWAMDESYEFGVTGILLGGLCYVPLLLSPVLGMNVYEQLLLVGITSASDTCAYFCGIRYGKHRIWPKVSPKKSIEGSLAGLLGSVVLAMTVGSFWGSASVGAFALLGLGLGIAAQFGDFFESALKRSRGVKDSGAILPGHGGVLDRIDSLLFVIPVYAIWNQFFPFFG